MLNNYMKTSHEIYESTQLDGRERLAVVLGSHDAPVRPALAALATLQTT